MSIRQHWLLDGTFLQKGKLSSHPNEELTLFKKTVLTPSGNSFPGATGDMCSCLRRTGSVFTEGRSKHPWCVLGDSQKVGVLMSVLVLLCDLEQFLFSLGISVSLPVEWGG